MNEREGEDMSKNGKYDCRSCTNRATLLCELCATLCSPSGKIKKPTLYCSEGYINGGALEENIQLYSQIRGYLEAGHTIPLFFIMQYNKLMGSIESENK